MEPLQMYRTPPAFPKLQRKRKFSTLSSVFNATNAMLPHDYQHNYNNNDYSHNPQFPCYHSWTSKKLKIENIPSLAFQQQHHHQNDTYTTANEHDMELSTLPGDLKKANNSKQMDDLPPEMVVEILRHLPSKDLLTCRDVNVKFNEIASYLLSPSGSSSYRRDNNLLESEFLAYCNLK